MFVCKPPLDSMIKFSSTVGARGRSEDNEEVEGPILIIMLNYRIYQLFQIEIHTLCGVNRFV